MVTVEDSIAARGEELYAAKIRSQTSTTAKGSFVVIDIHSEDYEVGPDDAAATRRLRARHPEAVTYAIRVGYPTTYRMGFRGLSSI